MVEFKGISNEIQTVLVMTIMLAKNSACPSIMYDRPQLASIGTMMSLIAPKIRVVRRFE